MKLHTLFIGESRFDWFWFANDTNTHETHIATLWTGSTFGICPFSSRAVSSRRSRDAAPVAVAQNLTSLYIPPLTAWWICIFLSFHFFLLFFSSFSKTSDVLGGDNMTLKLLSEWDETFHALLLKSFMMQAVPYLWDSCSVAPFVRHQWKPVPYLFLFIPLSLLLGSIKIENFGDLKEERSQKLMVFWWGFHYFKGNFV